MRRIVIFLFCLCLLFTGCAKQPASYPDSRRLLISAEKNDSPTASSTTFPPEELGGNFSSAIGCYGLKNVTIQIGEEAFPLENAIAQGEITVEELEAYARIDARKGFCKVASKSFNSLTVQIFTYPEYELRIINDLYETPDGQQHPIHEFDLADLGTFELANPPTFYHMTDSMDASIDREDWGLAFQVTAASSEGLTLSVSQSGGQHLGTLQISTRILVFPDEDGTMDIRPGDLTKPVALPQEGVQEIRLPWPEAIGELAPGNYFVRLYVEDVFEAEAVHPLMRDYTDRQMYHIPFTVEK